MGFLSANLLFLCSLASIPIIIHLIQRIRLKKIQYSSLFFLTETKRETFSWIRIKEILLLIFRTLFIFFLFFSLARPYFKSKLVTNNYEASRIIIIDDSYSMMYNTNFAKATTQAQKLLSSLKKGSEAAVLTSSQNIRSSLTTDLLLLNGLIDTLRASYSATTLEPVFNDAVYILSNASLARKEIFIITDLQKRATAPIVNKARTLDGKYDIVLVDVGKEDNENSGIQEIALNPGLPTPDFPSKPQIRIRNYSNKTEERKIDFVIKKAKSDSVLLNNRFNLTLGPHEIKTVPIDFEIRNPGTYLFQASLLDDSLPADNEYFSVITIEENIPVLLVFEDSSEIQYIKKVLEISHFDLSVANAGMLRQLNLRKYSAIGLFQPANLPDADWQRISYYLQEGGGVFVAIDQEIKARQWPNFLNINQQFTGRTAFLQYPDFISIGKINYDHPITRAFRSVDLSSSKFKKYWGLDSTGQINILAYFSSQKPFLIEGKNNKIIIALTSFNIDNTDFMFKASFLPLFNRVFTYLAAPIFTKAYRVGDTVNVQVDKSTTIEIITPDGKIYQTPNIEQGRLIAKLTDTKKPGIYQIGSQYFSVNVDISEGDLTRISANEVKNQNIKIVNDFSGNISDFTWLSLILAVLFFVIELVILIL